MTEILFISFFVILLIVGLLARTYLSKTICDYQDRKLRKWCIKQATSASVSDELSEDSGIAYSTEYAFCSLAEKYYLFLVEKITFLTDAEKKAIFPEKYPEKEEG